MSHDLDLIDGVIEKIEKGEELTKEERENIGMNLTTIINNHENSGKPYDSDSMKEISNKILIPLLIRYNILNIHRIRPDNFSKIIRIIAHELQDEHIRKILEKEESRGELTNSLLLSKKEGKRNDCLGCIISGGKSGKGVVKRKVFLSRRKRIVKKKKSEIKKKRKNNSKRK